LQQVPDNYQRKVLPDKSKAMQGVPAMVWQPPRYFMEHKTPTVLGAHNTNRQTLRAGLLWHIDATACKHLSLLGCVHSHQCLRRSVSGLSLGCVLTLMPPPLLPGPFESKCVPPAPSDDRAVAMIREKVAQRSKNVNDTRAAIQVRSETPIAGYAICVL